MSGARAATIFALSSGAPPAAIAIMRVSGPDALAACATLGARDLAPRRAMLVTLADPERGGTLDRALAIFFPGPNSATGEDVVELHLHGGRAIVRAVERALTAQTQLRPAEPGEFTRRAVLNGRIDLFEAEALGDLLAAETETQRRRALAAPGSLRLSADCIRDRVLEIAGDVEARLDHDEIEDAHDRGPTAALIAELDRMLARPTAERLRDGFLVVIAGPPNSGKSTLFNRLVGREAAITAPTAGTTRDILELPLDVGGLPVRLFDTAGLRAAADDRIEGIGMERALELIGRADVVLWTGSADEAPDAPAITVVGREPEPDHTRETIVAMLRDRLPPEHEALANQRQRHCLADVRAALVQAQDQTDIVLAAEHLRTARACVDRLAGRAGVEDMLDRVFARFCLGK